MPPGKRQSKSSIKPQVIKDNAPIIPKLAGTPGLSSSQEGQRKIKLNPASIKTSSSLSKNGDKLSKFNVNVNLSNNSKSGGGKMEVSLKAFVEIRNNKGNDKHEIKEETEKEDKYGFYDDEDNYGGFD